MYYKYVKDDRYHPPKSYHQDDKYKAYPRNRRTDRSEEKLPPSRAENKPSKQYNKYSKPQHLYKSISNDNTQSIYYDRKDLYTKKVKLLKEKKEQKEKQIQNLIKKHEGLNLKIGNPRSHQEILYSLDQEESDFILAHKISTYFEEKNFYAFFSLIKVYGREQVQKWIEEAIEIENEGGIATKNYARKRTPGGTFFYIVSRDTTTKHT